uniref:Uncharacterized protein n=1 Tax=uncultured organism TaxID=155900 RepID=A0A7L9QC69_9ZZZZ|nr:hypothetical protein [uncultured organism]
MIKATLIGLFALVAIGAGSTVAATPYNTGAQHTVVTIVTPTTPYELEWFPDPTLFPPAAPPQHAQPSSDIGTALAITQAVTFQRQKTAPPLN